MKEILTLVIGILASCNISDKSKKLNYAGFVEKTFFLTGRDRNYDLIDTLAFIQFVVPERLDTFYNWQDYSDCSSCGWMKYRFADKNFQQVAENGWMPTFVDSAYQLDIWHKPIKEAPDSITLKPISEKDTSACDYHPHIVWPIKPANFLFKVFTIINTRPFIISAFTSPRGKGKFANSQPLFVIAETNLNSRELYFVGACRAKDTTGFVESMYKSFLSIRIKENP